MSSSFLNLSENLISARQSCTSLDAFPGILPETPKDAYHIQDLCISGWDDKLVGWKVAGLKPELHEEFGENRQSGPVFQKNLQFSSGSDHISAPVYAEGFAAIEAEFVIELADVSALPTSNLSAEDAQKAIAKVFMGIEIASSPMKNTHSYGTLSPISDFGNNAGVIVGPEITNWKEVDLSNIAVSVKIGDDTVGTGNTKPSLDGPLGAVAYLIEHLAKRGHTIAPGTYISSGAITGAHQTTVGIPSEVTFEGIGKISLELIAKQP